MVRAVNAKGEGQFSSPSAPEHPLRQPDAPAAPVGERGDKFINVTLEPARQRRRPDHRVRGADPLHGRREPRRRARRCAGPTCPTARPSSSRCGPATAAAGARYSAASAPVVPCGVPDAPGSVGAQRGDGAATVTWAAPYDQGCAISGYTVTASSGGVGQRRRRPDVGDVRRAEQRHELHVHRRRPQRGRRRRPQRRLQRRRPGRPARCAADHRRHARTLGR